MAMKTDEIENCWLQ